MNLLSFWNLGLDNWDGDFEWWEWYGSNAIRRWWKRKIWSYTRDFIGEVNEKSRILHVGCGSSPVINFLPGYNLGIDVNPNKIYFLRNLTKADLKISDMRKIDSYGIFDVILANEFLEYLSDKDRETAIERFANMLYENGKLIVSFPDHKNLRCRIVERILHKDERKRHGDGYSSIDRKWLYNSCFKNNLQLIGQKDILKIDTVFGFEKKL